MIEDIDTNRFNDYFSQVGEQLAKVFTTNEFKNTNLPHSIYSFKFQDTTGPEVLKLLTDGGFTQPRHFINRQKTSSHVFQYNM